MSEKTPLPVYHFLVTVPDSGPPACEQFADQHELVDRLRALAGTPGMRAFAFKGDRLFISKPPRHLFLPESDTWVPLFAAPPPPEADDDSYLSADPKDDAAPPRNPVASDSNDAHTPPPGGGEGWPPGDDEDDFDEDEED